MLTTTRLFELSQSLGIKTNRVELIINRYDKPELPHKLQENIEHSQLNLLGILPTEAYIFEKAASGDSILDLPDTSATFKALEKLMSKALR